MKRILTATLIAVAAALWGCGSAPSASAGGSTDSYWNWSKGPHAYNP
jgi:ABC-type glycerol-3-phosphate transport system substrate-binding protein